MLESQRLQVEINELRVKMNGVLEIRGDDPDAAEKLGKRQAQTEQLNALLERQIAAVRKEDQEAQAALATHVDTEGWSPELREFRDLAQRVTIADYVDAVINNNGVARGAAAEYNEHVLGGTGKPGDYPLEMMLDRDEKVSYDGHTLKTWLAEGGKERTVITGPTGTHGMPSFVDRILAMSEAAFLGAMFPIVAPGSHSFPKVTGTGVAQTVARDTAETPAGGVTINDAVPERVQHSYEIEAGDELRLPGLFMYLARDLRMSLASGIDNKVVDTVVSTLAEVDDSTTLTLQRFLSKFASEVNGRTALTVNDVYALCNTIPKSGATPTIYNLAVGGNITNVGPGLMLVPHARVRGSAHLPAVDSSDEGKIIFYGNARGGGIYVPTWRRGQLLRDTGRLQLKGQVTLTGVAYIDVIIADQSPYTHANIDVA